MHHAAEAGDAAAVVRLGPPAARSAATSGAHREAAAHYRVVLGHREAFAPSEQAALLQASAIECYAVGDLGRSALADQSESVVLRRDLDDRLQLGTALRWLSRIAWWVGDRPLAEEAGVEAVAVLTTCDDRQQLALAHSNLSQLAMLAARSQQAVEQAELAIALGREVDDSVVLAHALNNLGTALWGIGDVRGRAFLEESLDLALETGQHENAARAYCNLVWQLCATHELEEAAVRVEEGIAHAEQTEHLVFWKYLHVEKAMINLARGRLGPGGPARHARPRLDQPHPEQRARGDRHGPGAPRRGGRRPGRGSMAAGHGPGRAAAHRAGGRPGVRGRVAA